jgi:hypothetical protein
VSTPQRKVLMGEERSWSHTRTLESAAVAKRFWRQWWSMEVKLALCTHVLSAEGS